MSDELIRRYARPVPRYNSYPTALHFDAGVTGATYGGWLAELPAATPIALHLTVPFCSRQCWICGCHGGEQRALADYVAALHAEIATVADRLDGRGYVTALNLGGGSASVLEPRDFLALVARVRQHFVVAGDLELSLSVDPHDMTEDRYEALAEAGVTAATVGIHDFDPRVQRAINRAQGAGETRVVIDRLRAGGVSWVKADILYGLPHQTVDTFERTLDLTLAMRPDRIALAGYAHVPWSRPNQKMIDEAALPGIAERYRLAEAAAARIRTAGYDAIGIDHFALPGDTLSEAARAGTLRQTCQGYTATPAAARIGFGAAAISCLPQGYVQNAAATGDYCRAIGEAGTAVVRGIGLNGEDRLRGWVIERLLCDFSVSVPELVARFGTGADPVVQEMRYSALCDGDELVSFDGLRFAVTERGRPFVRAIASTFDTYLAAETGPRSVAV